MSKDSFSPFKKIDGYGFGTNNPIMNVDPTGHAPQAVPTWLNYVMVGLGIVVSVVLAFLLPVSAAISALAAGIGTSTGTTYAAVATGIATGIFGVVSGVLQVGSTAHPDKVLSGLSHGASLLNGAINIILSGIIGAIGVIALRLGVSKLLSLFIAISSVSTFLIGASEGAGSGCESSVLYDSGLRNINEIKQAAYVLAYITMGFTVISILSGLGVLAPIVGEYMMSNIFNNTDDEDEVMSYSSDADLRTRPPPSYRRATQSQAVQSSDNAESPSAGYDESVPPPRYEDLDSSAAPPPSYAALENPHLYADTPQPEPGYSDVPQSDVSISQDQSVFPGDTHDEDSSSVNANVGTIPFSSPRRQAVLPSIANQELMRGQTVFATQGQVGYQTTLM